jgi:hypothetical protein
MAFNTKEIGNLTYPMVRGKKFGRIRHVTKGSIRMEENVEEEDLFGLLKKIQLFKKVMTAFSLMIFSMERGGTNGVMEERTKVNGEKGK